MLERALARGELAADADLDLVVDQAFGVPTATRCAVVDDPQRGWAAPGQGADQALAS